MMYIMYGLFYKVLVKVRKVIKYVFVVDGVVLWF